MASASSLLFSLIAATLLTQGHAFWREACSVVQTGRIDPILSPDEVSGHVHKIAGASNVNWYSDNNTLPASSCTSCEVQDDKSAYWTPQLYYAHSNGTFEEVPNYGMTVYFLAPTPAGDNTTVVAFPPGFKMISGDARLRSYDNNTLTFNNATPIADRVSFHCIDSSDPDLGEQPYMFRTDCDNGMRAQILFQSCWDGVNTYLPNSAHVAYQAEIGNGGCPPDHPVVLPLLFYEVLYWTIDIDQSAGGEFVFAQGDTTGYGFHGDFLNGWNQDVLETAVENCLSLADNPNGTVSTCSALAASDDVNFPRTCPEQPSFVPEPVSGLLDHLPGCNPVTSGPELQPQVVCQVNSTIPVSNSSSAVSSVTSTSTIYFSTNTETSASAYTTPSFSSNGPYPSFTSYSLSSSTSLSIPFPPDSTVSANMTGSSFPNNTSTASIMGTSTSTYPQITTFATVTNAVTVNTTLPSITTVAADVAVPGAFFINSTTLLPVNTTATPTSPFNVSCGASQTTMIVTITSPLNSNTTLTISLLPFTNLTAPPTTIPTNSPSPFFPFPNTTSVYCPYNTTGSPTTNSTAAEMTTWVTMTDSIGSTTTTVLDLLVPYATTSGNVTTFVTATASCATNAMRP